MGPTALVLIVLVVVGILFRVFLPGVLIAVGTPFWKTGTALSAGVGNTGSFFADRVALTNERDRLLAENAALTTALATSDARVADLTKLLGSRTEAGNSVLAGVLSRPPVSPYDVLVIDQGSAEGVSAGQYVAGPGGMPLGTVESVTKSAARVLLYSTPGRETESWIGEARIPVTVIGEGSGAMSAVVARDAGIVVGDLVYLMGSGAEAIGTVTDVANDPSSPRSRIGIKPLQNPFSITWVTVLP